MSSFFVIGAEAGSNLVQNPSAEASGNYSSIASTVTRDYAYSARFGNYSYKIVGSAASNGITLSLTSASTAASPHYVSFYARGHSGSLQVALTGPGSGFTAAAIIGGASGGWARYGASIATAAASGATAVVIRDITNETWYVDAVQVERQSYPTTYIDGSLDGLYSWAGQYHASTSYRDAQERRGGREYDLLTSFGVAVADSSTGLGAPPLQINTQSLALQPGTVAQSYKTLPAEIVLQSTLGGSTLAALHAARNALYGVIKPDAKRGYQPVMIGYSGANGTYKLWNEFYYASGLEQGALAGYYENPQIRLLAARPYWAADNQEQTALTVNAQVVHAYIAQRTAGSWAQMGGSGANGTVWAIAIGPDGTVYAGGEFTSIGGAGSTAYVAKWNGTAWSSMGGSGANNIVYAITVGPDGTVYAGGSFTSIGGAGSTAYVAKWNGTTWSGMGGTGANAYVSSLAVGQNGTVYAGGNFTSIGGAGSTSRVAKWNGTAWSSMGGSGADSTVDAIAIGPDGTVYAGGGFTSIGGAASTAYIAKWNGTAWSSMGGSGAQASVYAVAAGQDGTVYAGGLFTSIGGAASTAKIAKWNGTVWSSMGGSGANDYTESIDFDSDGKVYAGGVFTSIGITSLADRLAVWNGSVWTQPDIDLSGSPAVYVIETGKDKIYIGFTTSGSSTVSAQTAVTNSGTAPAYPTLTVINSGSTANTLQWLENQSTDQQQYYSQSINAGETLTVSMAPLNKTVKSNWRGTVYGQPLPNSDFANWRLLPGANTISTFITGTTTASCAALLTWTPVFAGVDGGA